MANRFLIPIYENIYNQSFSFGSFEKRMEMQKAIYLLQEMGIAAGDYNFMWYKHGPYSQNLQDDMLALNSTSKELIHFSNDAQSALQKLRDLLNREVSYSKSSWAECLASLHYLRANVCSFHASSDEILDELEQRKPHLNHRNQNLQALHDLDFLFS